MLNTLLKIKFIKLINISLPKSIKRLILLEKMHFINLHYNFLMILNILLTEWNNIQIKQT